MSEIDWTDAEREAVPCTRACVDRRALGRRNHTSICDENRGAILRSLAPFIAAREAQAAAKALRKAALALHDPTCAGCTDDHSAGLATWLRECANDVERGES